MLYKANIYLHVKTLVASNSRYTLINPTLLLHISQTPSADSNASSNRFPRFNTKPSQNLLSQALCAYSHFRVYILGVYWLVILVLGIGIQRFIEVITNLDGIKCH